jgi:hypothetical protein
MGAIHLRSLQLRSTRRVRTPTLVRGSSPRPGESGHQTRPSLILARDEPPACSSAVHHHRRTPAKRPHSASTTRSKCGPKPRSQRLGGHEHCAE